MNRRKLRKIIREEAKKQLSEYSRGGEMVRLDGITFAVRANVNNNGTIEVYLLADELDIPMDAIDLSLVFEQKTGITLDPIGPMRGKDGYSFRLAAEEIPKMIKMLAR